MLTPQKEALGKYSQAYAKNRNVSYSGNTIQLP